MLKFYYMPGPNPMKVALFLEEAGLEYEVVPVQIMKGEQHTPEFRAINPNGKLPAIVDDGVTVFDSNAILLYLAEKSGRFLCADTPQARGEMLSWLMFAASGLSPFCGQAIHFKEYAPEPIEYAINRYVFEAERHMKIVDGRLATRQWILGDTYTIVDMCVFGWARLMPRVLGKETWERLPHLKRWFEQITARPAAQRALALRDRFKFKETVDDETRAALFPQNARLKNLKSVPPKPKVAD